MKRRALGQHFLIRKDLCERIVDDFLTLAEKHSATRIIEIGPGKGALTNFILEKTQEASELSFTVVEKDFKLSDYWRSTGKVSVDSSDFLDSQVLEGSAPTAVLSNLPYSVAIPIFEKLDRSANVKAMVLMFQKEVGQRLRSELPNSNTKETSSVTLFAQNRWVVKRLFSVSPKAFRPPPKVDSEVLAFERRESPLIPHTHQIDSDASRLWGRLVRSAFAQRRKMLRKSLSDPILAAGLRQSSVNPTKRPEALSWNEWRELFEATLDGRRSP